MRALTWQGNQHVEVTDVPDRVLQEPTDIVIRVTSTAICGSDLHLYGVLGPYGLRPGDRVVIPFNISCGRCWMCRRELFGVETLDPSATGGDTASALIELVDGRGPDAVIDAVGMEAHGHSEPRASKLAEAAQKATGLLPDAAAKRVTDKLAVDRLDACIRRSRAYAGAGRSL